MGGFERLKTMEKEENNSFISEIVEYLLTRKDMEDKFLNEKKTLNKMNEFIEQKALALCINNKKKLGNSSTKYSSVSLNNNQVYSWAVMYFALPDEMLGFDKLKEKIEQAVIRSVPNITKTKQNQDKTDTKKSKEVKKELVKEQISLF